MTLRSVPGVCLPTFSLFLSPNLRTSVSKIGVRDCDWSVPLVPTGKRNRSRGVRHFIPTPIYQKLEDGSRLEERGHEKGGGDIMKRSSTFVESLGPRTEMVRPGQIRIPRPR